MYFFCPQFSEIYAAQSCPYLIQNIQMMFYMPDRAANVSGTAKRGNQIQKGRV